MADSLEGGGASRSTELAYGSSSGTDVSLREYLNVRIEALDRHLTQELRELRRAAEISDANSEKAIQLANAESKERLDAHNNLIEAMQTQANHFATRESLDDFKESNSQRIRRIEAWQAKLAGGIGVIAAIGIANLVKVWTG